MFNYYSDTVESISPSINQSRSLLQPIPNPNILPASPCIHPPYQELYALEDGPDQHIPVQEDHINQDEPTPPQNDDLHALKEDPNLFDLHT